ncbi:hypothetical protein ACGFJ7_12405 [Actinoplanes sp. NPDC048988]|uniref:hypothetical protein n=1 Tax=Actinoplanes sp. NPDC048988 TaxID=3363901 RepID=UPI00371C9E2E
MSDSEVSAGGGSGSPAGAAPPPEPDPIDKEIDKYARETAEARAAKELADSKFADKQNRLTALRGAKNDLDANQKAYEDAHDKLEREEEDYEEFYQSEKASLEKLLGPLAGRVKTESEAFKAKQAELDTGAEEAETALRKAEKTRDDAKADVKDKTARVTEYKKLAATITARMGVLKTRYDEITKERDAGKYAVAYWLLAHRGDYLAALRAEPKIIDPGELPRALVTALDAQATSEKTLAGDEAKVVELRAALAQAVKDRDEHRAKGEAALRKKLETLPPAGDATRGAVSHA